MQAVGAVQPSTTLSWAAPSDDDNVVGYRLYWRLTTEPQWTRHEWVGMPAIDEEGRMSATLENVVIDNYFFGVAAVSAEGFESPVVFPGPAGSFDVVGE